jgi:hypothetical protein
MNLIGTDTYLAKVVDEATGKVSLTGKIGYQTMHAGVPEVQMNNLRSIQRTMAAGELCDINDEPCENYAVIETYTLVRLVDGDAKNKDVALIRSGGKEVSVAPRPEAPQAAASDHPFGG